MGLTILKIVLIVIVVVALAAAGIAMGAVRFVRSYGRKNKSAPEGQLDSRASGVGTCSRCGQNRIIVAVQENMCAACYSALRTKKN
jgi:hypothetical protein